MSKKGVMSVTGDEGVHPVACRMSEAGIFHGNAKGVQWFKPHELKQAQEMQRENHEAIVMISG